MCTRANILIVDDYPIFRKGLTHLINEEKDMQVVEEAESVEKALKIIEKCSPDLVTSDIFFNGRSGIELISEIRQRFNWLPVLIVSMHDANFYGERALKAGARGYISKREIGENVIEAIRHVLSGRIYAGSSLMDHILYQLENKNGNGMNHPLDVLSDREFEVFQMVGRGLGRKEMGTHLHISVKTVGTYMENIKRKLHLKNMHALVKTSIEWTCRLTF